MNLNIKVDDKAAHALLKSLRANEIPTALRNATNDLARESIKIEQDEMRRVFDRPTPFILKGLRLKTKATKERPTAEVWFKDVYQSKISSGGRDFVLSTLTPHIPGFPTGRAQKGMERALIRRGYMRQGEHLVPSRTMALDRYGNVSGSTASKMLNDIGVFLGTPGFTSTTRASKVKYIWGEMRSRNGGTVRGIWLGSRFRRSGNSAALQMVVVGKSPTYRKRFDFAGVAKRWFRENANRHLVLAVVHAINMRSR